MPRREPDHRWRATARVQQCPEHAIEAALWRHRRGLGDAPEEAEAYELRCCEARWALEALLLSGAKDDDIAKRTRLTEGVLKAYRHLFFDVTVFRHHFDVIDWVKKLANDATVPAEAHQLFRWAVMHGVEAVAWLCGLPAYVDPRQVQERAMTESHFRALIGRDAAIDSTAAKEALKHQQLAVTQAQHLSKAAPPSARDFAVKLKHREMTSSIEVVDKTEVLH